MKKSLLFILLFLTTISTKAQNAGDVDSTFPIGSSINKNGSLKVTAIQSDGKMIVAGDFYDLNGVATNRIVRLNTDGTRDNSFDIGTGCDGNTYALAIQPDGKILVGGYFNTYNNIASSNIARLNTDGTLDTTFVVGTGFDSAVYTFAIQADNKIIAGGAFTTYNGSTSNNIVRLNANGSIDNSFNTGTGCNGRVYTIVIQPDGKSIIGGAFTTFNAITVNRLVRLTTDGTLDFSGLGFDSTVNKMVLQPDGKLIVAGTFTTIAGITENRIVRLNTDATIDTSFATGIGFDSAVYALALQTDGKLLVGGYFTNYNSNSANRIIRLNTNGSTDSTFVIGSGLNTFAYNIALQTDGKIVVVGDFNYYNGTNCSSLLRLNTNGTKDTFFTTNSFISASVVKCLEKQSDGKIIVGGEFTSYFGIPSTRLIRLNTDGTKDAGFNIGSGFNNAINAVAVQADGKILAGGQNIISYNGVSCSNLVRLNADGSLDTTFNMPANTMNGIFDIKMQLDGKIVLGGYLYINGVLSNAIVRLNSDGSLDTSFVTGTGFDSYILSLAIQNDGKIVVGGFFTSFNGTPTNYIARLNTDGSLDTTFITGTGFDYYVSSLAIQSDNKIVVGGAFNNFNSSSAPHIIRLNTDGTADNSFAIGTGFDGNVYTVAIQTDGKIIAGGYFTSYNTILANQIIRLNANGLLDATFVTGTGCNSSGYVNTVMIQNDNKVVMGGSFWDYNSHFANRIIRLTGDSFLTTESFNITSFSVYPNPTKNKINLQFSNNVKADKIVISDLTGKIILEQTCFSNQVDISQIANGLYILQTFAGKENFQTKFIKQ